LNDAIENLPDNLKEIVKNIYQATLFKARSISSAGPKAIKKITPAAKKLANDYNINYDAITGTGVNGNITINDVKQYILDNNISLPIEIENFLNEDLDVQSKPTATDSNNIFISFIEHGIKDGKVDAAHYNAIIRKKFGIEANVTQEELEKTIQTILSPTLNVGSKVKLVLGSNGSINIETMDGVVIGFLNTAESTQKRLEEAEKVFESSIEELEKMEKEAEAKSDYATLKAVRWRLSELNGTSSNKDFATHIELLKSQLYTIKEIKKNIYNILKSDPFAEFVTTVTRKSSGNLSRSQTEEFNLDTIYPGIDELYMTTKETGKHTTLYSNKDGKEFKRDHDATNFHNDDGAYDSGKVYMLVAGANTNPNLVNTFIPVPLTVNNISEEAAAESYDLIMKLVEKAQSLLAKGVSGGNILNNEDILDLKKELKDYFNINEGADKAKGDYMQIHSDYIEFSFTANSKYYKSRVYFKSKFEDAAQFEIKEMVNETDSFKDGKIIKRDGGKGNKVKTLSSKNHAEKFKENILGALKQKRHNINQNRLQDTKTPYKGEKNYARYLIKKGILTTNLITLKDGNGKQMKDLFGNPLPSVTGKNSYAEKNNNLVVSIDTKVESSKPTSPVEEETTAPPATEETTDDTTTETTETTETEETTDTTKITDPIKEAIKIIIAFGGVEVETLDIANAVKNSKEVLDKLPANSTIVINQNKNGKYGVNVVTKAKEADNLLRKVNKLQTQYEIATNKNELGKLQGLFNEIEKTIEEIEKLGYLVYGEKTRKMSLAKKKIEAGDTLQVNNLLLQLNEAADERNSVSLLREAANLFLRKNKKLAKLDALIKDTIEKLNALGYEVTSDQGSNYRVVEEVEEAQDDNIQTLLTNREIIVEDGNIAYGYMTNPEVIDKLEDNEFINIVQLADGRVKVTIETGGARTKAVQDSDTKTEDVRLDEAKVKAWWQKTFGGNIPLDMNFVGMIENGGQLAWGLFQDAMVKLSKSAKPGTEFHEAFHVVFWVYLDSDQRKDILSEIRKKYPTANAIQLEEYLADDYMDYMLKKGETTKIEPKSLIGKLFNMLYNWVTKFFRKNGYAGENGIQRLFEDIDAGKFNYKPDAQSLEYAKKITRNKVVDGYSRQQESEIISLLAKLYIEFADSNMNTVIRELKSGQILDPKAALRANLASLVPKVSANKRENIVRVLRDLDNFYPKVKAYVARQFQIEATDIVDVEAIAEIEKKWDDTSIFGTSSKDSVNNYIKKVIMTTAQSAINSKGELVSDTNTFLGLETFLDFNKVYPYIQRNMLGARTIQEMMLRLENMTNHDASISRILEKLKTDSNFRAAWFSSFHKQSPQKFAVLIEGSENGSTVKVEQSNKNTSHYLLSNEWKNNFLTKIENGEFNKDMFAQMKELITNIERMSSGNNPAREFENNAVDIIENLVTAFDLLGVNLTEEQLAKTFSNSVLRQRFGTAYNMYNQIFREALRRLSGEINAYNKLALDKKSEYKFNSLNRLNQVSQIVNLFQYDFIESSFFDVNGNNVYSSTNPNYLSNFFEAISAATDITYINQQAAKESLLTMLMEYASNPAMAYSNWLWDSGNNDGALLDDGTKNIDNLTVESLNLDFLKRFSFGMLDGIKNLNTRNSEQYNNMSDASWKVTQLVMYLQTGDRTTARVPILIPSDSGNIGFITTNRIRAQLENGKLVKGSQLHTALMNTLMQEYQRMVDARDLLFRKVEAEDGLIEYVPKEHMSYESAEYNSDLHVDYHKLEKGYHFNKFDSNNMPIIADKDNNATGKVFKFYNMEEANNLDIFQQKMIMHSNNPEAFTDMLMENFETVVDNFVSQQIAKGMAIFGNRSKNGKVTKVQAQGHIINMEEFQRYDSFNQLITEFMLNSYINNVEQFNFLIGEHAEYKHNKDTNKRAKEIISPVVSISTELAGETFTAATLADVDLMSSIFDNIATNIAEGIKRENPKLKKQKLNLKEIRKESPDTSKLNELSKATLEIVGGYKYITTADAQGYVSLDRYEAIVKGAGRWNDSYATLFETVRRGERLNGQQLGLFLQPLKGFYYARKFDPYLKKHVSSQIKYSSVPLIPQLVQGSNIEKLSKWMQENNLDEVFFESAQKVGATNIISITDKNGKINDEALSRFHVANGYRHRRYSNDSWGIQLDVPDHLMDTDNLLGSQIAKLILSNLPAGNTYQVGTDQYSTEEFIEHYFDVIATNIQEDAESLLERMGVVEDILPNGESVFSIPNKEKIYELLKGEVERRGLSDNYQEAIELVEIQGFENKDFNMPLFTSHLAKKWESILTSMFTNNVTNQRLPGGSAVLLSSLFIADKAAAEADTDQAKPTVTTVDEVDQTGINWLNSKKESGDYTLEMTNISPDGKVVAAEILLPAWSKKFYKEVETGKDADGNPTYEYVLDDINNVPKELRTMLWYRIPSEEKYSMVFAEVVGFLPQAMGSTIVMPHEIVTSTGADFDVDKKFGALRQFDVIQNIDGTREYKMNEFTNDTEVLFEQWLNSKQARELRKALKENPTEELKRIKTQVDRFNTRATNIFNQRQALFAANKEQIETVEKEFLTELTELLNLNNELSSIKDAYSTVFSALKEVREDLDIVNGMYSKTSINLNPEEDAQAQAQQAAYNQQIKQLNQILSMINEYVEESRSFREGAVEDIEHFKTMNTRANEVYKDYLERYRAQKIATLRQEFERELAATGVNRMNNRKARDNRIIDLWMSVLSNPMHYKDTLSPQSFSDGVDAMYELRDLLKEDSGNINPMTVEGQLHFRKQNISGRALKGMAADSNAFLTIAQVSKMELRKDLGFQVKYDLDTYNKEDLERKYGKGKIIKDTKIVKQPIKASLSGKMTFAYGDNKRDDITATTTAEAIKNGERTSTTRYESQGNIKYWKKAKIGDIIEFVDVKGEKIYVRVTKPLTKLSNDTNAETWSKKEGWSVDYFNSKVKPKLKEAWQIEYEFINNETEQLQSDREYIVITHNQLGWNRDGSFDNVDGKTTTAHASQMLAMILDIVKEGIPDNVNTYTFFPFITMLNTGINIRYASLFIRQPILNDLSELVLSNNGAFGTSNNTEIQEIKTRYQESLFSLKQKRGDYDAITDKDDRARYEQALFRKQEGNFTIFPNDTFFLLGYDVNQITPFSTEELVDSYGLYNKVRSKSSLDEKINFITMQLQVLENYKTYRKAGEAYTDATITFNADKLGAGPSLYKTENLNRNIKKATYYNKLHTEKEEGKPISYTEKSEGARILINTPELGKVPATMAVYTDSFTPQEIFEYLNDVANRDVSLDKIKANKIASKYRILEVYKKYANDLSIDVLKSEFIHQSNSFKELMNQITTITGLPYSENLQNNVLSYLTHQLIKEHPFFENIDFARLVGVSTPKVFTLDISQSVIKKQPHFKKDMEMAQESTKAIAKVTKAKSSKYNSSTASYLTALGESVTGINNEFTESDVVWVFGAGEWASSKEDIQKDFDEYYKAQIDAALEAGVSRFNIGKATGIDSLATKYLRKKGFKVKTKRGYYFIYNPSVTSANAESTKVITDTDISFEEFAELSAPNKLLIVKRMMKEDLQNDSHILNYLMPKLDNQTINKNGTHGISFVNTKTDMLTDDRLTDSFVEMFYSDNVFVADLARDLIAYNFASTGFEMKADSYSKLIPTSILSEVLGLGNFLRDVGNKMINVDYISSRYPNFVDNFLRSNSHNSKIVPFVETKWSNGIGSKTMNNTPIWNANQDGVITVLSTQLNKESMAVKSAEYITIPVIKTVNTKNGEIAVREGTKLYKKYGAVGRQVVKKKGKEQVEQTIFDIKYYEVSKLGGRNLIEYSETVLPSNEAQFSETEYIDNIENNRVLSSDLIKLRETNPSAYNLVMNSKDFIGDSRTLQKMFKSKKTFEVGENVLSLSNKGLENILSKGKLTGNFKKVYQALASEANILTTADNAIDQHLKTFSDKNQLIRYVTPQGYVAYTKAVSNLDIGAWQRKVLSPIEQEMLDNNKDINPNGKC
jgi:pyruvate/2-oxoglutarate dehydrogenase complex dihydrolipoamide acyltransferase (E2) component